MTKSDSRGAKLSKRPGNSEGGTQTDDNLPTNEELQAMNRARMTKLSIGDSEIDGSYEWRNDSIRHLKGVLQHSPFIRAPWGNDGTQVSMLMDTGAEVSLIDESVLTSVERETLGKPDTQPPKGVNGCIGPPREMAKKLHNYTRCLRLHYQVNK